MSEIAALAVRVKTLETKVKALEHPPKPKVDARSIKCSHSQRPEGDQRKCGWVGRADKYQAHLDKWHGGEEYKVPKVGIPIEED